MRRRAQVLDREALAAEIASLSKLGIDELRERWKAMFGKAPSRGISRSFATRAIAPVIAEARVLVHKSGGNSLLPRLREAEARLAGRNNRTVLEAGLREVEGMYRAMGAPDPADRVAKEMKP